MNPKIIVLEGVDGCGKTTQLELLKAYFLEKKIPFVSFDFPQYDKTAGGALLDKLLWRNCQKDKTQSEKRLFPDAQNISPYLISLAYAADRAAIAPSIQKAIDTGNFVLLNRYWTSNLGHQGAKIKTVAERETFIKWLEKLEIEDLKLPKEDIVILLDISLKSQRKLLASRGGIQDKAEKDLVYQRHCLENYRWLSQKMKHWVKIRCELAPGKMHSPLSIHNEIIGTLKKFQIIE